MTNLAIVPVRTGSKRIPNKNTRDFFGKPLFTYTMDCALNSGVFDDIVLTTEADSVIKCAKKYGYSDTIKRPASLAEDHISLEPVCEHVLAELKKDNRTYDKFCLLYPTVPTRTTADIIGSYKMLDESVESVWSVTDFNITPFWALSVDDEGCMKPTFGSYYGLQSQDLPPQPVVDAGSIYWYWTESFLKHRKFLLEKTRAYHIERKRSVDLDTFEDWDEMEEVYKKYFL